MKKTNAAESKLSLNSKKPDFQNTEITNIVYNYKNMLTYAPAESSKYNNNKIK